MLLTREQHDVFLTQNNIQQIMPNPFVFAATEAGFLSMIVCVSAADAGSPVSIPADGSGQQAGLHPSTPCWAYWDGQQQQVCSPHYCTHACMS